jgi:RNAse (barnase) inhibitor barstar
MSAMLKDLSDPKRAGIFQLAADPDEIAESAKAAGLSVFRLDLKNVAGKAGLLSRIAKEFNFPHWFGKNWDALNDCLSDLSWLDGNGWVIILESAKDFAEKEPEVFRTAVEVFQAVSDYWREAGKPFWVFVHGPADWASGLDRFSAN